MILNYIKVVIYLSKTSKMSKTSKGWVTVSTLLEIPLVNENMIADKICFITFVGTSRKRYER